MTFRINEIGKLRTVADKLAALPRERLLTPQRDYSKIRDSVVGRIMEVLNQNTNIDIVFVCVDADPYASDRISIQFFISADKDLEVALERAKPEAPKEGTS